MSLPAENELGWRITVGHDRDGQPAVYDVLAASNFHVGVIGRSGVGKTYLLRNLAAALARAGATVFVLDAHGDFAPLPGLAPRQTSRLEFRYGGDGATINPFALGISAGARAATRSVVETIRLFNPALGPRQLVELRRLVLALYRAAGWPLAASGAEDARAQRPPPTLEQLLAQVRAERALAAGRSEVPEGLATALTELIAQLPEPDPQRPEALVEAAEAALEAARPRLAAALAAARRGEAPTRSGSRGQDARLEAIEETLDMMVDTGLFGKDALAVARGAVNVFCMRGLHRRDLQVLYHLLLDRVFHYAMRTCRRLNAPVPSLVLVVDEAKLAAAGARDPMAPLNRIATEGRKYGLALLLGVQKVEHLTDDLLDSMGALFVLPVARSQRDGLARRLHLPKTLLDGLRPRAEALYSFDDGHFVPIRVFPPRGQAAR